MIKFKSTPIHLAKMRIPFRTLHLLPATLCTQPACLPQLLDDPVVRTLPVEDLLGFQTAFDIEVTQSFYLLLAVYVAVRVIMRAIMR